MSVYKFYFKRSSSSSLWTLILCSALTVWTPVQGEVQVIGSDLPIIAAPGDDVILPCHLEPMFDVRGLTVEWSKPDLKPDPSDRLSRVEYVHLYRDTREVPDMKLASYFRRTELFMDDLKHGNISLKILNVSEEDSGRYRCFIPKLRSRVKSAIVQLVVDPNFTKTSTTEMPLNPRTLQTPDPQDVASQKGRSRVSVVVVVISFISVVAVVALVIFLSLPSSETICKSIQSHKANQNWSECLAQRSGGVHTARSSQPPSLTQETLEAEVALAAQDATRIHNATRIHSLIVG